MELIENCLAGQQGGFTMLVARYKKLVFNVVYRLTGGRGDADDLSQEVFLRAYRSLGRYSPEYRFATWLMKIATHVCIDSFKQNRREAFPEEDITRVSDHRANPQEQLVQDEELTRMRRMVAELPEEYRVPVVLFHQQGLSYRELESVLNVPESIIKNRLYRARLMLRERVVAETNGGPT